MTVHSLGLHRLLRAWQDAVAEHGLGGAEEAAAWEAFIEAAHREHGKEAPTG